MEERDFYDERPEKKIATLNCPHCHQASYRAALTSVIAHVSPKRGRTWCVVTT
jgi:hypothetical protein